MFPTVIRRDTDLKRNRKRIQDAEKRTKKNVKENEMAHRDTASGSRSILCVVFRDP